jgi:hypothetical protein
MLKLFKNSFLATNDSIILATPLIIFLSILSWYCNYAVETADDMIKVTLAGITLLVMFCGFLSAWLYMSKKVIAISNKVFLFDKDRANALISIILASPKGIGKLFMPITCLSSINILVYGGLFYEYWDSPQSVCWILPVLLVYAFVTMLWIPEVVYSKHSALVSLKNSIINLFFEWKKSFLIYLYLLFLGGCLYEMNILFQSKPILYFFVLLIFYYYLVYMTVLLFTYYEQTFIKK